MSSFSINSHDQELSKLFEELDSSVRKTKLYFGTVGLKIALPFILGTFSLRLRFERILISRSLKNLIKNFHQLDERTQMKVELEVSNNYQELVNALHPLSKLIKAKNFPLSKTCLTQFESAQAELKYFSEKITSLVYPESIDPASNPELFKELVDCYKNVDLSDWKQEDEISKSKVTDQHAHV